MKEHLESLEAKGLIFRSTTPWQAPIFCVKKSDASDRIVLNYTGLNKVLKPEIYPLLKISDLLTQVGRPKFISVVDCNSGFFQVPLDEESQEKTGFSSPGLGSFAWRVMPQGISTGPAIFQKAIEIALSNLGKITALCYLDDLAILSPDWETHLDDLEKVFTPLIQCGMKLKASKTKLACETVKWLGHMISKRGIEPCNDKIEAVRNWEVPKTIKQVRAFLGTVSYYRKFIRGFSEIANPLNELLKKDKKFSWTKECQISFDELKKRMTSAPILQYPDFTKQFVLYTDSSNFALGAYLTQDFEGILKPIAYASRTLNKSERNMSTVEREILALIFACDYFKQYLYGTNFVAKTDHRHPEQTWLFNHPSPNSRLIRWALRLEEYQPFTVEYVKGKENCVADGLSRKGLDPSETPEMSEIMSIENRDELNLDLSLVSKMQSNDHRLKPIIEYLTTGNLTEVEPDRSEILKYAKTYEIIGNVLYKLLYKCGRLMPINTLVVPNSLKLQLLKHYHDSEMGGAHLGRFKTHEKIARKYFWIGLKRDVASWVKSCPICTSIKNPTKFTKLPMGHLPIPARPFQAIHADCIGPLRVTKNKIAVLQFSCVHSVSGSRRTPYPTFKLAQLLLYLLPR